VESRLLVLVRRRPGAGPRWDARLRAGLAGMAREGDSEVRLYLTDDQSRLASHPALVSRASFDALVDVGGDLASLAQSVGELTAGVVAYRVRQRRLRAAEPTAPRGQRTPGVFLVSAVHRAPALDAHAFDVHWRDRHHVGMCEYRQKVVAEALTPEAPAFDGIAQLGFSTLESLRDGLFDSAEGQRLIFADTARFLDLARIEIAFMGEYVL
jgi:hypothetical protein